MLNIQFEFHGGPKDGEILQGTLGEPSEAERFYLFSNRGTPGQRFKVASQHAIETLTLERLESEEPRHIQRHFYRVIARSQQGEEVRVRVHYAPEKS